MVTSDLGRVTTTSHGFVFAWSYCGDVRSRTSYNNGENIAVIQTYIVVTSDLGRVTTIHGLYKSFAHSLW